MVHHFDPKPLPDDVMAITPDALSRFRSFTSADAHMQQMLQDSAQGRGQAWQVFTLGLADVLDGGGGVDDAYPGGWRIAARSGDNVLAGDVYVRHTKQVNPTTGKNLFFPEGSPKLACIRPGEEMLKMLDTIQGLDNQPILCRDVPIPTQPYYLHLLLLPGLVTDALWLQPQNLAPNASYVIPFNTLITELDERKVYAGEDFIQIVRPVADKWKEYSYKGGDR